MKAEIISTPNYTKVHYQRKPLSYTNDFRDVVTRLSRNSRKPIVIDHSEDNIYSNEISFLVKTLKNLNGRQPLYLAANSKTRKILEENAIIKLPNLYLLPREERPKQKEEEKKKEMTEELEKKIAAELGIENL